MPSFEYTELLMPTNVEEMLRQGPLTPVEDVRPCVGVSFACTSPQCEEVTLSMTTGAPPVGTKYGTIWSEIRCTRCRTKYRIRWPDDNQAANMVKVERIEESKE